MNLTQSTLKLRQLYCILFANLIAGIVGYNSLSPAEYESLFLMVFIDLFFTIVFLVFVREVHEITFLVLTILAYYAYVLGINGFFDYSVLAEHTTIGVLSQIGLRAPEDLFRYQFLYVLFKVAIVTSLSLLLRGHSTSLIQDNGEKHLNVRLSLQVVLFVGCSLMTNITGLGFFGVGERFFASLIAVTIVFSANVKKLSIPRQVVLAALVFSLFLITRSRTIIAVIFFFWISRIWIQHRAKLGQYYLTLRIRTIARLGLVVISGFIAASLYGVFRAPENWHLTIWEAMTSGSGYEVRGEGGLMFLFGSHLCGLKASGELPDLFTDSVIAKVVRIVPLIANKTPMLATRYVEHYFPGLTEGAGWAFSQIAEAFIFGNFGGVLGYGLVMGATLGWLTRHLNTFASQVLLVTLITAFQRSEIAVFYIFCLYGICWLKLYERLLR